MLTDVLRALVGARALAGTLVISRDPQALGLAAALGATPLREEIGGGLNAAVAEGTRSCIERGASGVLIAMGDLPLLTSADVEGVLERLPRRGLVLAPSLDGTGTNLLAACPADALPTRFGPQSLEHHLAAAAVRELPVRIHECPGAALDIDTLDDLDELMSSPATASVARRLLAEHGIVTKRAAAPHWATEAPTSSAPWAGRSRPGHRSPPSSR